MLTKDEARIKRPLEQRWTELVYEGLWFSPAARGDRRVRRQDAGVVTGEVRIELRPDAAVVTGRRSETMLYEEKLASYGAVRRSRTRRPRDSSVSRPSKPSWRRRAPARSRQHRHDRP